MRISIVTPSFNQVAYLPKTAQSILSQQGDLDLQWIVIDGGSTDGSVDLLKSMTDPRLLWLSEPDNGQAHAINKGMTLADGEIVGWLNSDDLYVPGTLAAVAEAFAHNPSAQWLAGFYEIIGSDGVVRRSAVVRYKERQLIRYRYRKLLRENFVSQPAVFWRKGFADDLGPLDESLHWTMDYDLWLRMGRVCNPLIVRQVLAQFRLHELSKSGRIDRRQFDEQYQVARRYFEPGDLGSRIVHRLNVEKIVWAYRVLGRLGV